MFEKVLQILLKVVPTNYSACATTYNNIAIIYAAQGDNEKTVGYLYKTIEFNENSLPPNHLHIVTAYNNLAHALYRRGDFMEALVYMKKAYEIDQKTLPHDHPCLTSVRRSIIYRVKLLGKTTAEEAT
ncbi:unnamed protein product [Rotaria magnacalcarata]|uniref:Kinesin light chain n=1 Tax=Rotaria magnacalcarata TaxID=392030 RepID=A0A815TII2_9BILA|nr:unnamed protein product [Rotaria magnacalcarata]CAF1503431.1 unnamed protein product [Rotaria magnacalcarata]CAF2182512.1 unnamed protein product [Rotaria magnacalcarata]CAF2238632.1 unnamed protein product [Rotaria magnacalcarata]CAF3960779.1 unnamed protein product [Rotaria magnacalcarata]